MVMGRTRKAFIWIAIGAAIGAIVVQLRTWRSSTTAIVLTGAVLRDDPNPTKQSPVANATVIALGSSYPASTNSDASGLFKLTVYPPLLTSPPITLKFEHAEYQPLEISTGKKNLLYIVRMEPLVRAPVTDRTETPAKPTEIKNVRVRYSMKNQTTITVGSVAKQFEVANTGNVPCQNQPPCSPDGRWKASIGRLSLDADKGNEFRNVRVSCIAGPCPFTSLQPTDLSRPERKIDITALDWSDTASFLVEAEVTRTMASDMVLQSYPFITGETMSFALPAAAEGPSVVADLNGTEIVFPLGPTLILSWANCTVELAPGRNKIYRCELKPGYNFQQ
jgi:hypothetical protein